MSLTAESERRDPPVVGDGERTIKEDGERGRERKKTSDTDQDDDDHLTLFRLIQ